MLAERLEGKKRRSEFLRSHFICDFSAFSLGIWVDLIRLKAASDVNGCTIYYVVCGLGAVDIGVDKDDDDGACMCVCVCVFAWWWQQIGEMVQCICCDFTCPHFLHIYTDDYTLPMSIHFKLHRFALRFSSQMLTNVPLHNLFESNRFDSIRKTTIGGKKSVSCRVKMLPRLTMWKYAGFYSTFSHSLSFCSEFRS